MKRDKDINNPLADFLGKHLGNWAESIIEAMSSLDKELAYKLMDMWWDEQFFIEKHAHDAFIIYGHVAEQENLIQELRTLIKKNVKAQRKLNQNPAFK